MENNFISKFIQGAGIFFNVGLLISQYFLRNEFRSVFRINEQDNFKAFSLAALIIGLVIIIGLFANRHTLANKIYLARFKTKNRYFSVLRSPLKGGEIQSYNPEPFYIDGKRIAWFSVLMAVICFALIFQFEGALDKSIFYLLFALLVIVALTIFLLSLYVVEEWQGKEKERRVLIDEKIRLFFSPKYKEITRLEDRSNFIYPALRQVIEVGNERYNVASDLNDPDKYFSVEKIENESNQKNATNK